ncbi:TetR/AcrR family transcriptional regulator [Austwickia chelonae]|uniref:TetR/AcrR family transcriptional regulator n=1 Tax=Austwickia chelonae TaxID=100225 RepID=UPI0013C2A74D|nr:TetR-like C-terminal domain-containing protein [Austwickia chelonae]
MTVSELTDRALAASLRELLLTHRLPKITVRMITEHCGVSRHTFYNHFCDIHDLLVYLFRTEIGHELSRHSHENTWPIGVGRLLDYTVSNRELCLGIHQSVARIRLERMLLDIFSILLERVIDELPTSVHEHVTAEIRGRTARFFGHALLGVYLDWLDDDLVEPAAEIHRRVCVMLTGTVRHVLSNQRAEDAA